MPDPEVERTARARERADDLYLRRARAKETRSPRRDPDRPHVTLPPVRRGGGFHLLGEPMAF